MKEVKKRKAHLPEFKAKVGLEALRGEKTVNQIGQEYGVHPVQVGQWKKEIQAQAKSLFEVPHAGARAGVTGCGLEGFTDAVLKVFGI